MTVSAARGAAESMLVPAARLLAAGGVAAVGDVLELCRRSTATAQLVLRSAAGEVVASTPAPALVPAQAGSRRAALDLPVRCAGTLQGVLTATADDPITASAAERLGALADLLGLTLAAVAGPVRAARVVLDAEADRALAAAELQSTVGEGLVSIRYAVDRLADPALTEPVNATIAAFRHAHRDLRAHALEAGLRAALAEIALRSRGDRPDDGQPALAVTVDAPDEQLDLLPPAVAVTLQRVAEAALRGANGRASVSAAYTPEGVKLCVESADIAYDASELDRWARRVSALGGVLRVRPDGVELDLPASPRPEGRHDHGPDL